MSALIEIGSTVTLKGDDNNGKTYTVVTRNGDFAGLVSEGYIPPPGSSKVEICRHVAGLELTSTAAPNADISATPIATVTDIHNF